MTLYIARAVSVLGELAVRSLTPVVAMARTDSLVYQARRAGRAEGGRAGLRKIGNMGIIIPGQNQIL